MGWRSDVSHVHTVIEPSVLRLLPRPGHLQQHASFPVLSAARGRPDVHGTTAECSQACKNDLNVDVYNDIRRITRSLLVRGGKGSYQVFHVDW